MEYLSTETKLNIDFGKVISLNKINKILFSNKEPFCTIDKITLLNSGIIKEYENENYLILNKISNYIELIENQKSNLYFPYNYYNSFITTEKNINYENMFKVIDEYLDFLDTLGNQYSYLIKHILHNGRFLNSELTDVKNDLYCLRFDKKTGKALHIFMSSNLSATGILSYGEDRNYKQYEDLYECHKKILLMDEPEEFLINNLEKVTGDLEFSKMIVHSYLIKNDYKTSIKGLCNLVEWKNEELMEEYINFFVNKYNSIVKNIDGEYMTNFEGFNKFLLSLEVKYLQQWENKEQINELYYQITHELIKSYEILYNTK